MRLKKLNLNLKLKKSVNSALQILEKFISVCLGPSAMCETKLFLFCLIIIVMEYIQKIQSKFYRTRSKYWRDNRYLFPSPAEIKFIRMMGGRVFVMRHIRHHQTGYPAALVLSLGKVLKRHGFEREIRAGKYWIDFGSPERKVGIEVDGLAYHLDIVLEQQRDDYLEDLGWRVLHVEARKIFRRDAKTMQRVLDFLGE